MSLQTNTLWGMEDKEKIAIERLKTFEPPEGFYLAFSGGKDSIVIYDLAVKSGVKFDAHYHITGIDPPDLYYFIRDKYPSVERTRPETTIWKLIQKKKMLPTRLVRYCCEYLKERGGSGRMIITGIRQMESVKRSGRRMLEPCFRDKSRHFLNVIIEWSETDVWEYIHKHNLEYCKLYDEGWKRIGCLGCPMCTNKMKGLERYPKFKKLYDRAILKLLQTNPEKSPYSTVEEGWKWWNQRSGDNKQDPDQTVLFE
jgi:phosphoadenosine phosphosulfate reductase